MHTEIKTILNTVPGAIVTNWGELAFPVSAVSEIIKIARENRWIILGGDVLNMRLEHACANWYFEPDPMYTLDENVKRSIQKTKQYIENFTQHNGNDFLYVFVISNAYVSSK